MSFIEMRVEVQGVEPLLKKLATVQEAISDFRPVWPQVAQWFYTLEQQQFATEGGGSWAPLAPSTVKGRGSAHPILIRSGRLYRSLTDRGAEGAVYSEGAETLTLGTDVRVGSWNLGLLHQLGTRYMPARRPIFPTRARLSDLRVILHQYIFDIMKGRQ
jgi:hypothetical protein